MHLRRAAAAARATHLLRTRPAPSSVATRYLRSRRPRADGAAAEVVREDEAPNVAGIRVPDIRAAIESIRGGNIRFVADVPDARLHYLSGGVPPLPLTVRVDRITPGVLRRLGALPIDSKVVARHLKPYLEAYKADVLKTIKEELEPYKHRVSILAQAARWVDFIASMATIVAAMVVTSIWAYSKVCPDEFQAILDGVIDGVTQSGKFSLGRGWFGGETLEARRKRKAEEEKMKRAEEEKVKRAEEMKKKKKRAEEEKVKRAEEANKVKLKMLEQEKKMKRFQADDLAPQRLTLLDHLRHAGYLTCRDRKRMWAAKEAWDNSDAGRWERDNRGVMATLGNRIFWGGRRF